MKKVLLLMSSLLLSTGANSKVSREGSKKADKSKLFELLDSAKIVTEADTDKGSKTDGTGGGRPKIER